MMEPMLPSMRSFLKRVYVLGLMAGTLMISASGPQEQGKLGKPAPQAIAPTLQEPPVAASPAPAVPAAPQAQSQPAQPDPVAGAVAAAEKAYESGLANSKAGHLDAAKLDFTRAVDILKQGPVSVESDDRLQQEFDKITEELNSLEMAAFKKSGGFAEQKAEPAPIDEANQVTFPVDPSIKTKAEADLKNTQSDLPLIIHHYVATYINYYSTRVRGVFHR